MKRKRLTLTYLFLIGLCSIVFSQKPVSTGINHSSLEMDSILKQGPEYDLIKPSVGKWKVVQTIYSKDGRKYLFRILLMLKEK